MNRTLSQPPTPARPGFGRTRLIALAAACLLAAPHALRADQEGQLTNPDKSEAEEPTTGAVTLADKPMKIDSLGLSIRLPAGAKVDTTRFGAADASFTMYSEDNTWRLQLHSPTSRDKSLTLEDVADALIQELQSTRRHRDPKTGEIIGSAVEVFDRTNNLSINGARATRFYSTAPNDNGPALVNGYTIFNVGPGRFAVLELTCLDPAFERARGAYETVIGTINLQDPQDLAEQRAAGVIAADKLLESINGEDLSALIPSSDGRWFRIYRPAPDDGERDAEEVAYQHVDIREGQRGELNPDKPQSRWTQTERQHGFIAEIKGRFLEGERIVDSQSIFFLSTDRSEEAWSVRMAIREDGETVTWTETGARGQGSVEVTIDQPAQPPTNKQWQTPPEAYLSQAERYLLPRLYAQFAAPSEFAYYTYQSSASDILLRRDVLKRAPTGDGWIIESRQSENAEPSRTIIDKNGRIIRRELASGAVMVPTELRRLLTIWRRKGLPTR